MSERIRGGYDDALYNSTYTLLYIVTSGGVFLSKYSLFPTCNLQKTYSVGLFEFLLST